MQVPFIFLLCILFFAMFSSTNCLSEEQTSPTQDHTKISNNQMVTTNDKEILVDRCLKDLGALPTKPDVEKLRLACNSVRNLDNCRSTGGIPIFHYERIGSLKAGKKILAIGLVHGNEAVTGTVARVWMERLTAIEPRNSWRVIPILNPDGRLKNSRTNLHGVDLNRNFPTKDWDNLALDYWKTKENSNPDKFPGLRPASEPETQCIMEQIRDFGPDLVVAIHAPLGVMDFDGPKVEFPKSSPLPWISLGNYPGSLGRYQWRDQGLPVLTVELKGNVNDSLYKIDQIQDISGLLALLNKKNAIRDKVEGKDSKKKSNMH